MFWMKAAGWGLEEIDPGNDVLIDGIGAVLAGETACERVGGAVSDAWCIPSGTRWGNRNPWAQLIASSRIARFDICQLC
jgi:hypothetical protein